MNPTSRSARTPPWPNRGRLAERQLGRRQLGCYTGVIEGNIDPAIPRKLRTLVNLDPNWKDGPAVIAGIRNRLVHPRRAAGFVAWPPEVLADAWRLSSLYLELVLLHALGVRSKIRDRLGSTRLGATVKPPWV